jgi:hypothetical protein
MTRPAVPRSIWRGVLWMLPPSIAFWAAMFHWWGLL